MSTEHRLDTDHGNANGAAAERAMRAIRGGPVVVREAVFFSFYMDAPLIVDWLRERGVKAHYEQRDGEGVTIVLPTTRAYICDHIITDGDGWAIAVHSEFSR